MTEFDRERTGGLTLYVRPKSPGRRSSFGFRSSGSGSGSRIEAVASSSASFSASLSCSAGDMMYCGTYSDCEARFWLGSSHSDEGDMHAFRVMRERGPPDAPNDIVIVSTPDDVAGRMSLSKLNIDRLSSSADGLTGPCDDVLLRALDPENSRLRGLVTLLRRGSTTGEEGWVRASVLVDAWPLLEEPWRSPGSGGRGTREAWKDRCLRGVFPI